MKRLKQNYFSGSVSVFHELELPVKAVPAGYSALIDAYNLSVPMPRTLFATGEHHKIIEGLGWKILTPRLELIRLATSRFTFSGVL